MAIDNRPNWDEYFMDFAVLTARRSTCLRRQVGAVIVQDKHIIATGYNGAPRGIAHCGEREGGCLREEKGVPSGEKHELCRALHAEQNAIIQAKEFSKAANITGITLNKLDGTAKGGIVISIKRELGIPVKFIGVGEKIDDMQQFDAKQFVDALFE